MIAPLSFYDAETGWECHSADRLSYIQKVHGGWGVWWKGWRWHPPGAEEPATYDTREEARRCIRALKSNEPNQTREERR